MKFVVRNSNFEFLELDWDLKKDYHERAIYIEKIYVSKDFDTFIKQIDKFEKENKNLKYSSNLIQKYNEDIQSYALRRLRNLYNSLKKIAIESGQEVNSEFKDPIATSLYQANEMKIIYIQTADNSSGNWPVYEDIEKIGDATTKPSWNPLDFQPNSKFLQEQAEERISQYMKTSGIPFKIDWVELAYRPKDESWFRDHDVHNVLKKSGYKKSKNVEGNEWWEVDVDTAKEAINAVKKNKETIDGPLLDTSKIILRPEQKDAVNKTRKVFKNKDRMLWNAKMRFGKTLATYQLIKEEKYKSVLILTHRPVVSDSWFEDFSKLKMKEEGYRYGSKTTESIESLVDSGSNFVYFASIQDLRGSNQVGGKQGEKNEVVFSTEWDFIVFDEAHEGTKTELAQNVERTVTKKNTKILELSGTPFNLLDQYSDEQVFTWDYVMEQEAKLRWEIEKPELPNPYQTLPKVNMFTFEMENKEKFSDDNKAFNFKEFFRVKGDGFFAHESDVNGFLNEITKESKKNYPYSTAQYRNELRHSLWLLPGVAEAKALKSLMDKHPIFGKEYKIINVVDKNDKEIVDKNDPDLGRVRDAISKEPWKTKTITLTVRKLTTGVNVKEWTAVMFLNNTSSAMTYLQAAFRAQTPYSNRVQGQKTNAYIFDFAPDRALTVMAESAAINSGVGKRNTPEQKIKMDKLLNFLPIIGMEGNRMTPFNVDKMLTQLKKVYAEKAVRSGFDDDSLYSDTLLTIDENAAELFNKLQGIIGKTGASKEMKKVSINEQGLTDEEYELAEKSKNKRKNQLTSEEQEAIEKYKKAKKERKNAISILRGISIRIPLMIFGMEIDISKDIGIETFIKEVDDVSWKEFMPVGVTKQLFKEQAKYYDPEVFIEAGRIIRSRAKYCDDLTYTERSEQIALLHGTFKNPDKETVLTPWRVVNMQLVSTFGGFSFYNDDFSDTTIDGSPALRWIDQVDTETIYKNNSQILEINSKTGLYPLFIATSFFYKRQMKFIEENMGKINKLDEEKIIQDILKNNVYVIAKTPMAKTITQRTLAGYKNWETNIIYIPDIAKNIKNDLNAVETKIKEEFNIMKFDAVVGNPPYQLEVEGRGDQPSIYNHFIDLGKKIGQKVSMIHPARFLFNAGSTKKEWNTKMLNDEHFRVHYFEQNSSLIFPNTDIKGGVAITYWDENKKFSPIKNFVPHSELRSILDKVNKLKQDSLADVFYSNTAYKYADLLYLEHAYLKERVSGGSVRYLSSSVFDKFPEVITMEKPDDNKVYARIYGRQNNERVIKFMREDYLCPPKNYTQYKVFIASSNGSGKLGETLADPFVGKQNEGATETFISLGSFKLESSAENLLKYIKTKFVRALLGTLKITQSNKSKYVWTNIPLVDFTSNDELDWKKSIAEIDQQLYAKYGLDNQEIKFIEENIKEMK